MKAGCILLAAGGSRRMGANKLAADLAGKPVIGHVLDAVEAAGLAPAILVLGHDPAPVLAAVADRAFLPVTATDCGEGMARSIAAGITAVPDEWTAAIICLGDMPLVSPVLLSTMAELAAPGAIVAPMFEGKRGNPVLWGRDYFGRLMGLKGDRGARDLLAAEVGKVMLLPWGDDGVLVDVDRPEELELVRQRLK